MCVCTSVSVCTAWFSAPHYYPSLTWPFFCLLLTLTVLRSYLSALISSLFYFIYLFKRHNTSCLETGLEKGKKKKRKKERKKDHKECICVELEHSSCPLRFSSSTSCSLLRHSDKESYAGHLQGRICSRSTTREGEKQKKRKEKKHTKFKKQVLCTLVEL